MPARGSQVGQNILHIAVETDLFQELKVWSEFTDFVQVVGIGAKGDAYAGLDAFQYEIRLRSVVMEIHLGCDAVLFQEFYYRVEEPRWHFVAAENPEGVGEDLNT